MRRRAFKSSHKDVSDLADAIKNAKFVDVGGPAVDQQASSPALRVMISDRSWLTERKSSFSRQCFVRNVYDILWERVLKCWNNNIYSTTDLLVLGNPGIGTSWSLNYLLYKALQEAEVSNRIVILRSMKGWYTFHKGKCQFSSAFIGDQWLVDNGALDNNRALILHDHLINAEFVDAEYGPVSIVFASSPNRSNYKAFEHRGSCQRFILPTWSLQEFKAFAFVKYDMNADAAVQEFTMFGGVLRQAFQSHSREHPERHTFSCQRDSPTVLWRIM